MRLLICRLDERSDGGAQPLGKCSVAAWRDLVQRHEPLLEGLFARRGTQRFFDKQGAVHARVSIDFAREFGCLLEAAL